MKLNESIKLIKKAGIEVRENESLKKYNTYKVGGEADALIIVNSVQELIEVYGIAYNNDVPVMILGKGSNVLISDKGIEGFVVILNGGFDYIKIQGDSIIAGAGFSFSKLAINTLKNNLSGLGFAASIPGTVGGAVFMNAGAYGHALSDYFVEGLFLDPRGELLTLTNEDMKFNYRQSILQECDFVCIEAKFKLKKVDNTDELLESVSAQAKIRKSTQPLGIPNCGSVFRNPGPGVSAGMLIEQADLKGFTIGGAQVSTKHANFIVNIGDAKADDVIGVIEHVQKVIEQKEGIKLHTEVRKLGRE